MFDMSHQTIIEFWFHEIALKEWRAALRARLMDDLIYLLWVLGFTKNVLPKLPDSNTSISKAPAIRPSLPRARERLGEGAKRGARLPLTPCHFILRYDEIAFPVPR